MTDRTKNDNVDQTQNATVIPRVTQFRLAFGKYKGFLVEEAPLDYLVWVLQNVAISIPLRYHIESVLREANFDVTNNSVNRANNDHDSSRRNANDDIPF